MTGVDFHHVETDMRERLRTVDNRSFHGVVFSAMGADLRLVSALILAALGVALFSVWPEVAK